VSQREPHKGCYCSDCRTAGTSQHNHPTARSRRFPHPSSLFGSRYRPSPIYREITAITHCAAHNSSIYKPVHLRLLVGYCLQSVCPRTSRIQHVLLSDSARNPIATARKPNLHTAIHLSFRSQHLYRTSRHISISLHNLPTPYPNRSRRLALPTKVVARYPSLGVFLSFAFGTFKQALVPEAIARCYPSEQQVYSYQTLGT
jgi:hypothetical protein